MLVLVHFVALLVQIYSLSYLHDEPKLSRYFAYLQLFIGAMLGIVLSGNLLVMYAFWELVGLASYLLIGFYTERPAASKAAQKAFLMNRVGDIGFLIGIFLTYYYFDTLDFLLLVAKSGTTVAPTVLGLCLFMGCVGKSAQFPLLTWLPDAMEGPTPVSALLHAATMVAAGIFLLARIHPLLSPDALVVIALVGTITTVWGGYSALFQTDIKKGTGVLYGFATWIDGSRNGDRKRVGGHVPFANSRVFQGGIIFECGCGNPRGTYAGYAADGRPASFPPYYVSGLYRLYGRAGWFTPFFRFPVERNHSERCL